MKQSGRPRFAIDPRLLPELERNWKRVDVVPLPPCAFIAGAMQLSVVDSANRDEELVTHSASERARLREGEMMRI